MRNFLMVLAALVIFLFALYLVLICVFDVYNEKEVKDWQKSSLSEQ